MSASHSRMSFAMPNGQRCEKLSTRMPSSISTGFWPGRRGTTAVTSNVWHHAAATWDGTTWRLYLDGVLDTTLAVGAFTAYTDFLHALEAIKEGDGTLLDNAAVLGYSDTGFAKNHTTENIPMFIAGAVRLLSGPWRAWPMALFLVATVFMTGSHNITLLWSVMLFAVVAVAKRHPSRAASDNAASTTLA